VLFGGRVAAREAAPEAPEASLLSLDDRRRESMHSGVRRVRRRLGPHRGQGSGRDLEFGVRQQVHGVDRHQRPLRAPHVQEPSQQAIRQMLRAQHVRASGVLRDSHNSPKLEEVAYIHYIQLTKQKNPFFPFFIS